MAKNIYWIVPFVLCFFLYACSNNEDGSNTTIDKSGLIESVFIKSDENNALRVKVNVKFSKQTDFYLQYREKGTAETVKTPLVKSAWITNTVLILLKADTEYEMEVVFPTQLKEVISDIYSFKTEKLPTEIQTCILEQNNLDTELHGYILLMKRDAPGFVSITDTKGQVLWYEIVPDGVQVAKFDPEKKSIYAITGTGKHQYTGTTLWEMDLYGNTIIEKNIKDLYPHHDIIKDKDNNYMIVNFVPEVFDLTSIGGLKEHTVFGDGYTVISPEGNIKSKWDCFTEINPLTDLPNVLENNHDEDWIHANSIGYDSDGNYYMSFNNTSEMWKIDHKTGDVLYRVGEHGNIKLSTEYYADGLHAVRPITPDEVLVLDNGMEKGRNRALIYSVDTVNKEAKVTLNIETDSKYYSRFMSNVQFIEGKDMLLFCGSMANSLVFTDLKGKELRVVRTTFLSYRAEYIPKIDF